MFFQSYVSAWWTFGELASNHISRALWIHYIHLREYFIGPWYVSDFHFRTLPWTAFGIVAVYLYHIHIRICLKMGYPKIREKYSRRFPIVSPLKHIQIPILSHRCPPSAASLWPSRAQPCGISAGWGFGVGPPKFKASPDGSWWTKVHQSSKFFNYLQFWLDYGQWSRHRVRCVKRIFFFGPVADPQLFALW